MSKIFMSIRSSKEKIEKLEERKIKEIIPLSHHFERGFFTDTNIYYFSVKFEDMDKIFKYKITQVGNNELEIELKGFEN